MASTEEAPSVLPQKVRWGPDEDDPAGIHAWSEPGEHNATFIGIDDLVPELARKLLWQAFARPSGYQLRTFDYQGKPDWLARICTANGEPLYGVWFGKNPEKNWKPDGLIYIGDQHAPDASKVWQIWQRYSNGSYRLIFSRCGTLDENDRAPIPQ